MAQHDDVSLTERLSALGYRAGWAVTARLPQPLARGFFNLVADIASGWGKGPEQLRKNLSRVVGPENVTRDLVRASMRSYMRYWREAFQLPALAGPELAERVEDGFAPHIRPMLEEVKRSGSGGIIALTHSGNWDMAGMWLVHAFGEFTTVAERLKPESLFDAFVDFRSSLGFRVIALTGSERPPMDLLEAALREGSIVCLLCERDLTGHGVPVTFFGETTSMPAGSAILAKRVGCPMVTAGLAFSQDGWITDTSTYMDTSGSVEEIVQAQATWFEGFIRRHPEDWHMLQPLWWSDLSEARLRRMGIDPSTHKPLPASEGK